MTIALTKQLTPHELADILESGKYAKTKNKLFDTEINGYCCLGVWAKECGILEMKNNHGFITFTEQKFGGGKIQDITVTTIPKEFAPAWMLGLEPIEGNLNRNVMNHLIHLNDTDDDWIRVIAYLRTL